MSKLVAKGDILLGKYTVERILGQGGMGYVIAVRHNELHELFAMKLMLPSAAANQDASARFLREARAAARLKSDHVAHVHDVGRLDNGAPYMVMEYLTGRDLKEYLKARGPLPLGEVITFMLETCEALAEAHALGIVHRDLKPANLFLFERPNIAPVVKILDFGISKYLPAPGQEGTHLTDTGAFMGSPCYMSPEQMADGKSTDPRSDLWSLGIVFFELLTGRLPFEGAQLTEIVVQVLNDPTPSICAIRRDLPKGVDAIASKCLAKSRENRYQSVDELTQALRRLRTEAGSFAALPEVSPFERTELAVPPTLIERPESALSASVATENLLPKDEPPVAIPIKKAGARVLVPGAIAIASLAWVGISSMQKANTRGHEVEPQSAPSAVVPAALVVDPREPTSAASAEQPHAAPPPSASVERSKAIDNTAQMSAPSALPSQTKPQPKATTSKPSTKSKPIIPGFNE